jgi:hypothetical protein
MKYYQIWCNLKEGAKELEFYEDLMKYLGYLREHAWIENYHVTRRRMSFGLSELGEFNITMEVQDLNQLQQPFQPVSPYNREIEKLYGDVYALVKDVRFALYRDLESSKP